jgi:hypothetical protein
MSSGLYRGTGCGFGAGQYAPQKSVGRRLVALELTQGGKCELCRKYMELSCGYDFYQVKRNASEDMKG